MKSFQELMSDLQENISYSNREDAIRKSISSKQSDIEKLRRVYDKSSSARRFKLESDLRRLHLDQEGNHRTAARFFSYIGRPEIASEHSKKADEHNQEATRLSGT